MSISEFDLIAKYFLPLSEGRTESASYQNDAATLTVPDGKQLVVTSDTLNAGVHFLADQPAATIAKKALRTNISDVIAMGARPFCYQLNLALPRLEESWVKEFTASLSEENKQYDIFCSGGDTTSIIGGCSVSITAFGMVDKGRGLSRSGARAGDAIVLTGFVGDAWCGLQSLRERLADVPASCIDAYYVPDPPLELVPLLSRYCHAALDISDGLVADLSHLAQCSQLKAIVMASSIEFSPAVKFLIENGSVRVEEVLGGGDDYQIICAIPQDNVDQFLKGAKQAGRSAQVIGRFEKGDPDVMVLDKSGQVIAMPHKGWQHFQK